MIGNGSSVTTWVSSYPYLKTLLIVKNDDHLSVKKVLVAWFFCIYCELGFR